MSRTLAFMLSGAGLGFFIGSSMGIATGGTAFNAVWLFAPLGAFIGWLLASRNSAIGMKNEETDAQNDSETEKETERDFSPNALQVVAKAALAILASVWNFQIDLLDYIGVLDTFVRQPILFFGLVSLASFLFPPIFPVYFFAWLGANSFGINEQNKYRATVE